MKLDRRGLSVLDMIISMAIFVVIALFVFQSFDLGSKGLNITYTESRLQSETRKGFDYMMLELRNSNYDRVTVLQPNVLQFRTPTICPEGSRTCTIGDITWSAGQIEYSLGGLNNQQLLRRDLTAGTSAAIVSGVTNLQFTKNGNPETETLTINMTIGGTSIHGTPLQNALIGTVDFRN